MKCSVTRKELLDALSIAYKAISSKSPLPILTHFLLETGEGRLKISATDSDLGIETAVAAQDVENGSFTTPAKTFFDIVNLMTDEYVDLKRQDGDLEITADGFSCRLMTLNAEDFPIIPHFDDEPDFIITQKNLKKAIKNVLFSAASNDETRAVLTGISLSLSDNSAEFAATDARRLAVASVPIQSNNKDSRSYIIPRRTLDEISKFLQNSEDPVFVGVKKSLIFFQTGGIFITSRLLEGRYPNFKQVIPEESKFSAKLSKSLFYSSIKWVTIVAQERNFFRLVKMELTENSITLRSNTPDLGSAFREIKCDITGNPDFTVAFNGQFILDILSNIDGEDIIFEVSDGESPGIIRSTEDPSHICVVMPMKVN